MGFIVMEGLLVLVERHDVVAGDFAGVLVIYHLGCGQQVQVIDRYHWVVPGDRFFFPTCLLFLKPAFRS